MGVSYRTVQEWFDADIYVDFKMERTKDGSEWVATDIGNPADTKEICRSETFLGCVNKAYLIRSTGGPKINFDRGII